MNLLRAALGITAIFVLSGCGGGKPASSVTPTPSPISSPFPTSTPQGSQFTATFYQLLHPERGISKVSVFLHDDAGNAITRTQQSDSEGNVSFTNIIQSRIGMTFFYDTEFFGRKIATYSDIPVGHWYMEIAPFSVDQELPTATITFDSIDNAGNGEFITIDPPNDQRSVPENGEVSITGPIDGSSVLALVRGSSGLDGPLLEYGFLTDLSVENGGQYRGSVDHFPQDFSWSSIGLEDVSKWLNVFAYSDSTVHIVDISSRGDTSGIVALPFEFPADIWDLHLKTGHDGAHSFSRRIYRSQLGTEVQFSFTSTRFQLASFDSNSARFEWALTDYSKADWLTVSVFGAGWNWDFVSPPDRPFIKLPELSDTALSGISAQSIDEADKNFLIVEYDDYPDFDSRFRALTAMPRDRYVHADRDRVQYTVEGSN